MAKEVSAGAVIFRVVDDIPKFLLLHARGSKLVWGFPKGKIEQGEQPIETARREIKEETGLIDLDFKEGFAETIHYFFKQKEETISKDVHFFLVETRTDKVTLSKEHIGYIWLSYETALKKLSFKNSQDVLKKANAYLV
jgi:8-oxo-dGTP pyrophosphatase MutT (NUDIX family)